MNKAVIIGASSGIGKQLVYLLAKDGVRLGLAARRLHRLKKIRDELPQVICVKEIDVAQTDSAMRAMSDLLEKLGQVDLIVFSSGIGEINEDLYWEPEKKTIATNVTGFAAISNVAINYFITQKHGHYVALSSLAALRGAKDAPAYNASKAFESNYLQGLRQKVVSLQHPITITDIQPGFVDTKMAKGDGLFWVAPAEKAAAQIYHTIKCKRSHAYVTKRWRLIAWVLKILPDAVYNRL